MAWFGESGKCVFQTRRVLLKWPLRVDGGDWMFLSSTRAPCSRWAIRTNRFLHWDQREMWEPAHEYSSLDIRCELCISSYSRDPSSPLVFLCPASFSGAKWEVENLLVYWEVVAAQTGAYVGEYYFQVCCFCLCRVCLTLWSCDSACLKHLVV